MNSNVHTAEVVSPRAMLFVGIVAFHAVLGYLLASGLMKTTFTVLKPVMKGEILTDPIDRPPPPTERIEEPRQPVTPTVVPEPPDIPVITEERTEPVFVASEQDFTDPVAIAQPVAPVEPSIRLVGRNVFPNADSYYPSRRRRDLTEGTALVRACVDERGKLNGSATIESSTGFQDMDDAALRIAKDARYARSMKGDVAVPNCHRFRVTFALE